MDKSITMSPSDEIHIKWDYLVHDYNQVQFYPIKITKAARQEVIIDLIVNYSKRNILHLYYIRTKI